MKMLRFSLLLGLLLILATSVVSADSPHPGPAESPDVLECWVFEVEFNWYYIEDCSPTIALITNSQTGVLHWPAKAQLPADAVLPDQGAYHFTYENSGFACWWEEGVETTNYSITITPNGKFNISCHFRSDKWQPEQN